VEPAAAGGGGRGLGVDGVSDLARAQAQTPQVRSFNSPAIAALVEKVIDVVGLYLAPPKDALVLCVDEKVRHEALSDSSGVKDPDAGSPQRPGGS
jgi:hypothetical protein